MDKTLEVKAVSNILATLEEKKDMTTLASFLIDMDRGLHRKWRLFRQEVSNILMNGWIKGRPKPHRMSRPMGNMEMGAKYIKEKEGRAIFAPQLRLTTLKPKQQVTAILKSGCSMEVKEELLATVLKI